MKLTIIGASGQGKVVAEVAEKNGYDEIEFLDDNESLESCGKWAVVGTSEKAEACENALFVAIGNSEIRKRLMERYADKFMPVLIHPSAVVSDDAAIGRGSVVMAGAIINPGTSIGEGCILNTVSSVDHDCIVEDYVHIAVGAHLCGTVKVGAVTWVGAGATVCNNVNICGNTTVGAGAVVIRNIEQSGTYVGIPAKIINK